MIFLEKNKNIIINLIKGVGVGAVRVPVSMSVCYFDGTLQTADMDVGAGWRGQDLGRSRC